MKFLCSEEGLRRLAGNLVGAQFLRVTPFAEAASALAGSGEYEIFAEPGSAASEPQRAPVARETTAAPHEPAPSATSGDEAEARRSSSGALDWAEGYQRHKAAERKRRVARYTIAIGLLVLPLSALIALA